jgi:hypothetical protein
MERHRTLAPALRKVPTLPQAPREGQRENPKLLRYLRVKPCPIKRLQALVPAEYQAPYREVDRDR